MNRLYLFILILLLLALLFWMLSSDSPSVINPLQNSKEDMQTLEQVDQSVQNSMEEKPVVGNPISVNAGSESESLEARGFVSGRVFDTSGQPALGGRVTWIPAGGQEPVIVSCESDGTFLVSARLGQILRLKVDCDDALRMQEGYPTLIGQQVTGLRAIESMDPIHEFFLTEGSRTEGRVVDPEGQLVEGALVRTGKAKKEVKGGFMIFSSQSEDYEEEVWPETVSRADGSFILSGMPINDFRIWAEDERYSRSDSLNLQIGSRDVVLELKQAVELSGTVRDMTGRPVEVSVELWAPEEGKPDSTGKRVDRMLSRADTGEFLLGSPYPGGHIIWIDDPRYAPLFQFINLQPGTHEPVELMVGFAKEWRGRALSSSGGPISGARWDWTATNPFASNQFELRPVVTDETGFFSVRITVEEAESSNELVLRHPEFSDYLLNTGEWPAGIHDLGDVYLEEGLTLRGTVRGPDGFEIEGATVHARYVSATGSNTGRGITIRLDGQAVSTDKDVDQSTTTDATGSYVISLKKPGEIEVYATSPGYSRSEAALVQMRSSVSDVDLILNESWQISGRVVDRSGLPIGGVRLDANPLKSGELDLSTLLGANGGNSGSVQRTSDPNGFFRFDLTEGGLWEIGVSRQQIWVSSAPRTLEAGESNALIEVMEGGRIEGTVIDAITRQPVTPFRLARKDERPAGLMILGGGTSGVEITDADGYFEIIGLPEKDVTLEISRSGYVDWSESFATGPGIVDEIIVSLTPAATLKGTVLNSSEEPLSKVTVLVYRPGEEPPESSANTDGSIQITFGGEAGFFSFGKSHPRTNDQGIYEIPELAPGDWMVTLRHPDYQERTFMVSGLQPGSTTTVATQRLDLIPDSAEN